MQRVVVLLGILFVCSSVRAEPVRIGVSANIPSLPFYVAQDEGFFSRRGVDVEFKTCVGGDRCLRSMFAGETELATASELPVVFNSFTRQDFSILTSVGSVSNDLKVLANTSQKITEPSHLRGKTLGYVKGSASQYLLDLVLVYNGIDSTAVSLKEISPETALAALTSNEVDALCISEPFVSRIQQQLGADVQLVPIPKLYTQTFNLIAMNSAIKNKPRQLARIVMALKDASQFIQDHPDRAKALLAKRLNLPIGLIEKIFDDYRFRLSLNRSLPRTMEGQARWALREGHVHPEMNQPNYNKMLYLQYLKELEPSAVTLP